MKAAGAVCTNLGLGFVRPLHIKFGAFDALITLWFEEFQHLLPFLGHASSAAS